MENPCAKTCFIAAIVVGVLWAAPLRAQEAQDAPPFVTQTNLVSDIPGLAQIADPKLVNPWGLSHSSTSPFWTSNQGTNSATLYTVTDKTTVTKVDINPPAGFVEIPTTSAAGPQGPTGQVNNINTASFLVNNGGDGGFAHFIFANLNGTISAWDTGPTAFTQVTTSGGIYTGLAINGAQTQLYAANGAGTGSIDVFDSAFDPVTLSAGAFVDPSLPSGLVPFNVQDINGFVYVAYAPAGRLAQVSAPLGAGAIAVFDETGNFIQQLVGGGRLAAPWGIALAPPGFGQFAYNLLVGNFSYRHSEINAYNPITGKRTGTIPISTGGIPPGGLWAIGFGVGGSNGDPGTLYFTDGINSEMDGLFGAITATAATAPSQ